MIAAALSLKHPMDFSFPLPDILVEAIVDVISLGPRGIMLHRVEQIKRVLHLRKSLQNEEMKVHEALHPELRTVLRGKQLLLWKNLLKEENFEDETLVDEVMKGFDLVGPATYSPSFPHGHQPAKQTPEQLKAQATWRRSASIGKCKPSAKDPEADQALWEQTLEECEAGWLQGPFESPDDVTRKLGHDQWICTRRFPIRQSGKTRIIDDALESGLNSAYSAYNKLRLMDLDSVISMATLVLKCFLSTGRFRVQLSCGRMLEAKVHREWGDSPNLLGRALDLKSAYKQLAANPAVNFNRVLVAWSVEHKQPRFFLSTALMFGSTASVYAFNRCAASLWFLAVKMGKIWSTFYFDDYPILAWLSKLTRAPADLSLNCC